MANSKKSIEILTTSKLFDEREQGIFHTPFEIEKMFYSCISRGNIEELESALTSLLKNKIVVGKLSLNNLRQMQYTAVCSITLATRYAIIGGLDETVAYNFSDECIIKIDSLNSEDEILNFLIDKSKTLTLMVNKSKNNSNYPKPVKKCLRIINTRLFEDLHIDTISQYCGVSKDYLSLLFKKNIGITIPQYIKKERLNASKELLENGMKISQVAYNVGFCSESYFIKCFKEKFGITPNMFIKKCKADFI